MRSHMGPYRFRVFRSRYLHSSIEFHGVGQFTATVGDSACNFLVTVCMNLLLPANSLVLLKEKEYFWWAQPHRDMWDPFFAHASLPNLLLILVECS
jgi:hypothetical protein